MKTKNSFIMIDKFAIITEFIYRNTKIAASLGHGYLILCLL